MATLAQVSIVRGADSLFTIQALMNSEPLPFNGSPAVSPCLTMTAKCTGGTGNGVVINTVQVVTCSSGSIQ
jgi:hypothetical protein